MMPVPSPPLIRPFTCVLPVQLSETDSGQPAPQDS